VTSLFRSASKFRAFASAAIVLAAIPATSIFIADHASAQPSSLASTPHQLQSRVTPVAVFGTDERQSIPDRHAALSQKIGTLILEGSTICSAFCVAPDVIATASHCLFGTAGAEKPSLTKFAFKIGLGENRQSSRFAGGAESYTHDNVRSGTENLSLSPPIEAANDWAVARLARPICSAGGITLSDKSRDEIADASEQGQVFQVAMHRDLSATRIVFGGPCAIKEAYPDASAGMIARDFSDPASIILHDCDTGPGSSGSPMLIDTPGGPEVIGINVGTYVLSRVLNKTADNGSGTRSEAIANTALETARFRAAVEELAATPHMSVLQRIKPVSLPSH
jgi:V8-like Glu-specific endopeptidase